MRPIFKLLIVALVTIPVSLVICLLSPFDPKGKLAYRWGNFWSWAVLKTAGVRLKVQGLQHIDPGRQYIFMANHQSNIDIPILVRSLPGFQLRWLAKRELVFIPIFGWALWASRHVLVNRSNRARAMASLRKARDRIAGGISLAIFPEGTRSPNGELLPFKRGGFLLAVKTGTPIVPITINGSGAVLPKTDWRLRSGEIEVIVNPPVDHARHGTGELRDLINRVRNVIEAHSRPHIEGSNRARGLAQAESLVPR